MYVWAEWFPPLNVYFYASLEDYQGGEAEYDMITAVYNTTISLPASPTRTDYIFIRWVYKDAGETIQPFTATTPITSDMYIWAEWTRKNAPVMGAELEEREWATGNSSTTQYHYFYATEGSSYTVRWNDRTQGDGTKTGSVYVSAYWYDTNTSIFSNVTYGYANGRIFTASKTGYVMLKAEVYSSYGTYAIVYADLAKPPIIGGAITAGQWAGGSISSSNTSQCYYFYATAGSSYTVRWNDRTQGDGTKTGSVYVSAYWYDTNTSIFSNVTYGYTNGRTFTALKDGYVMLKVEVYSSYGTHAITYQ
jgi:hypothetical protein